MQVPRRLDQFLVVVERQVPDLLVAFFEQGDFRPLFLGDQFRLLGPREDLSEDLQEAIHGGRRLGFPQPGFPLHLFPLELLDCEIGDLEEVQFAELLDKNVAPPVVRLVGLSASVSLDPG